MQTNICNIYYSACLITYKIEWNNKQLQCYVIRCVLMKILTSLLDNLYYFVEPNSKYEPKSRWINLIISEPNLFS